MQLSKQFIEKLNHYINLGYITKRKHDKYPIYILKYTRDTQTECSKPNSNIKWDEVLIACRGLVIDENYNVLAKAFDKFFNEEELTFEEKNKHANKKYKIQEKMDGSLIILFNYNNEWITATQKSFHSEISIFALNEFNKLLNLNKLNLDTNVCYGLEFTSPMNRVVVNYGENINFTLLIARDVKTLTELNINKLNTGFSCVNQYDDLLILDTKELKNINSLGKEGFVISFEDGFRYKLKFENYLKLHYLLTGLSTKEIQRMLMNNQDISLILEETPDEFDNWVLNITKILNQWYSEKLNEIYSDLNIVNKFFKNDINLSKKELADFIKKNSFILNKGFILSTFNKENWEKSQRTQKYIWAYVDEKRKEAQLKNDGLLPISFFKEPNFEF